MGNGAYFHQPNTMASADSIISFDLGRAFAKVYLQIPSMPSSTALDTYASTDKVSFYQVRKEPVNTSTVQASSYIIAASAGANGGIVPVPGGFRFYRFIATDSAPSGATTFKLIGGDS